ncbi:MAG: phage tail protein [Ectothiorhodospiraceae bacterium]|nr:phage tail protein [Ectothiorhodospiraceae bacterium]
MRKLTDLRDHLLNSVPELKRGPDRLLTFVEDGSIEFWRGDSLSHLYRIPVRVVVTDYRGSADDIVIPVLEWLRIREPGNDPRNSISFETEILSNDALDLSLTIQVTERVIVTDENGERSIHHVLPEPELRMDPGAAWQLLNPDGEPHE